MTRPLSLDLHLTAGRAAALLQVSTRTVAKWVDAGKLGGYRLPAAEGDGPGDRRVPVRALIAFCAARQIPLPPEVEELTRRHPPAEHGEG